MKQKPAAAPGREQSIPIPELLPPGHCNSRSVPHEGETHRQPGLYLETGLLY